MLGSELVRRLISAGAIDSMLDVLHSNGDGVNEVRILVVAVSI